jgi:hypothetical protein
LREAFIAENPGGLSAKDLALVASWEHRRAGPFYVLRHLKKYSLFMGGTPSTVYGVLGLVSPLEELVPFVPCYVQAILLPFEDRIIYDSLMAPYNITFGRGIRQSLEQSYRDAKERGAIVTSLLPPPVPSSSKEHQKAAHATNTQVLDAFRTHLFRAGLSPKVVERDLANVTVFAEEYLLRQPEPSSLREFGSEELGAFLGEASAARGAGQRRQMLTSLKRFVRFLRDTERMDYDGAEYALEVLKGQA